MAEQRPAGNVGRMDQGGPAGGQNTGPVPPAPSAADKAVGAAPSKTGAAPAKSEWQATRPGYWHGKNYDLGEKDNFTDEEAAAANKSAETNPSGPTFEKAAAAEAEAAPPA